MKTNLLCLILGILNFTNLSFAQVTSLVFRGDVDLYEKEIVRASDGNVYCLLGRNVSPLEESVVVVALNAQNELLWKKEISSPTTLLRPGFLRILPNGQIAVFMDDFAQGNNVGGSNISIALLNTQGEVVSFKRLGTVLYEEIDDMVVLPNGHWLLIGNMEANSGYGVFMAEIDGENLITTSTFQVGLYDYPTQIFMYNQKFYLFGTTYIFPGPAQPMLMELNSSWLPERTWIFSCQGVQGAAGAILPDESGFHMEVSCDEREVFFRFENGEITTQPKDAGYGYISDIHIALGKTYFFNPKEYSLRRDRQKKYHVGTDQAGITKITFSSDGWTGLGSVKENNKGVVHLASGVLDPGEDCGSYAFGSLPPLTDKEISLQTPNYNSFSPPLIRYINTTDMVAKEAVMAIEVICSKVNTTTVEDTEWKLFPNPASNLVFIPQGVEYSILRTDGTFIHSGVSDGFLDISQIKPGSYLLKSENRVYPLIKI